MVFDDDVSWQSDFFRIGNGYAEKKGDYVRWRSWGTERLLVEAISKNLPWLRTIYILLARESQYKDWMDMPKVRVVYHHEFIPQEFLPMFNSRGIEMFLHKIPDIGDYFIYGNDDMFPLSPLKKTDFFRSGMPCLVVNEKPFPEHPNAYQLACMNGLNFVAEEFGKRYVTTWLKTGHSLSPILKSTCEHLWKREDRMKASVTPFRQVKNFNQYIYSWWNWMSGKYVRHAPSRKYVSVKSSVKDVRNAISEKDFAIVCVNDNECVHNYMEYGDAVAKAIRERLKE